MSITDLRLDPERATLLEKKFRFHRIETDTLMGVTIDQIETTYYVLTPWDDYNQAFRNEVELWDEGDAGIRMDYQGCETLYADRAEAIRQTVEHLAGELDMHENDLFRVTAWLNHHLVVNRKEPRI